MLFQPPCNAETTSGKCKHPASTVEVARKWLSYHLRYAGPGGSNGSGDPIDKETAARIIKMFSAPVDGEAIDKEFYDGAGLCKSCAAFYCPKHWSISSTGFGTCPQGHGKSLDPHWSPDSDFLDFLCNSSDLDGSDN